MPLIVKIVLSAVLLAIGFLLRRGTPRPGSWLYPDPDRSFYYKKIELYCMAESVSPRVGCPLGLIVLVAALVIIWSAGSHCPK